VKGCDAFLRFAGDPSGISLALAGVLALMPGYMDVAAAEDDMGGRGTVIMARGRHFSGIRSFWLSLYLDGFSCHHLVSGRMRFQRLAVRLCLRA